MYSFFEHLDSNGMIAWNQLYKRFDTPELVTLLNKLPAKNVCGLRMYLFSRTDNLALKFQEKALKEALSLSSGVLHQNFSVSMIENSLANRQASALHRIYGLLTIAKIKGLEVTAGDLRSRDYDLVWEHVRDGRLQDLQPYLSEFACTQNIISKNQKEAIYLKIQEEICFLKNRFEGWLSSEGESIQSIEALMRMLGRFASLKDYLTEAEIINTINKSIAWALNATNIVCDYHFFDINKALSALFKQLNPPQIAEQIHFLRHEFLESSPISTSWERAFTLLLTCINAEKSEQKYSLDSYLTSWVKGKMVYSSCVFFNLYCLKSRLNSLIPGLMECLVQLPCSEAKDSRHALLIMIPFADIENSAHVKAIKSLLALRFPRAEVFSLLKRFNSPELLYFLKNHSARFGPEMAMEYLARLNQEQLLDLTETIYTKFDANRELTALDKYVLQQYADLLPSETLDPESGKELVKYDIAFLDYTLSDLRPLSREERMPVLEELIALIENSDNIWPLLKIYTQFPGEFHDDQLPQALNLCLSGVDREIEYGNFQYQALEAFCALAQRFTPVQIFQFMKACHLAGRHREAGYDCLLFSKNIPWECKKDYALKNPASLIADLYLQIYRDCEPELNFRTIQAGGNH